MRWPLRGHSNGRYELQADPPVVVFAACGQTLSVDQKAAVEVSLTLLKKVRASTPPLHILPPARSPPACLSPRGICAPAAGANARARTGRGSAGSIRWAGLDRPTALATRQENGFSKIVFWGRVNGIEADYLIAQGYTLPYAIIDATSSPATSFYRCGHMTYTAFPGLALSPCRAALVSLPSEPMCLHADRADRCYFAAWMAPTG